MPATRRARTSGGPATKGAQSTLSFGGRSRVTKAIPPSSKLSKDTTETSKAEILVPEPEASKPKLGQVFSDAAVETQEQVEPSKSKSEDEELAEKVTAAQIKEYWRKKEAERTTLRVHQEDLSIEEKVLRLFDVSSQYGPCIGIGRMKRWVRAKKLGLKPPIEVLAVLLKEEGNGNSKIERAYIDELMLSKFIVGES